MINKLVTGLQYDLLNYIVQNEYENYIDWCEENDKDTKDLNNNRQHVYAMAVCLLKEIERIVNV